ncbi:MAG: lipid A biosynthesis lauroyl acyltransferase [Bdellovibrionales bacterium CG10_big_fil_rev_8_21_14_0_10_45_34]|nr:MAG: lipid A biosynthesis lauroyl acyltransferase [Bdellovibrionales bacterium CG10_big_fil_rev_8_21_14_0_10_45_34]
MNRILTKFLLGSVITLGALLILLPRKVTLLIGNFLGVLWFDVLRIRRNLAIDHVLLAFPKLTRGEAVKIARRSLYNVGNTIVEIVMMAALKERHFEDFFEMEDLSVLGNQLAKGRGALVLTLHLGNGDLGCAALSLSKFPVSLISKRFKSEVLNKIWFQIRNRLGTEFLREEKSQFEILRHLKRNRAVIFVLDQFMGPPVGVAVKFFGVPTGTAAGLAVFAKKLGQPVIPMYTYRNEQTGKLHIVADEPIETIATESIESLTQKYTDWTEKAIRKHPGQWMWIHRRWKRFA